MTFLTSYRDSHICISIHICVYIFMRQWLDEGMVRYKGDFIKSWNVLGLYEHNAYIM